MHDDDDDDQSPNTRRARVASVGRRKRFRSKNPELSMRSGGIVRGFITTSLLADDKSSWRGNAIQFRRSLLIVIKCVEQL